MGGGKLEWEGGKMKMSEGEIVGFTMIALGIFAQFCETWWFGWNKLPATLGEFTADIVCQTLWIVGLIVMMMARWMR